MTNGRILSDIKRWLYESADVFQQNHSKVKRSNIMVRYAALFEKFLIFFSHPRNSVRNISFIRLNVICMEYYISKTFSVHWIIAIHEIHFLINWSMNCSVREFHHSRTINTIIIILFAFLNRTKSCTLMIRRCRGRFLWNFTVKFEKDDQVNSSGVKWNFLYRFYYF